MRKYQKVWETLLEKKTLTVRCREDMHGRLIKALFKEKDRLPTEKKKWRLEATSEGDLIHFRLRQKVNIYDL